MIREYTRRLAVCIFGLALCSLSMAIAIKAGEVGTNAWNTLALGIARAAGTSFGGASLMISSVIVIIDIVGRGRLGFGTLFNAFLIPYMADLFVVLLAFVPDAPNMIWGMGYTLFAQILLSFALVVYMRPALGCGPRDTLMVIVGKMMPKAPIGVAKFALEAIVLVVGTLLGAPFGLGSVVILILQASMFQFACHVCRFEPRAVAHENFMDTVRRIKNR